MRLGEIADVDVVAQAGAVGRRIILPEHAERRPAVGGANRERDQVKLGRMIFANRAIGMRARRVEIPQRDPANAVRPFDVRQRLFDRQLGLAVGVDRLLAFGLENRHRAWFAVDRAVEENTNRGTRASRMAASSANVPATLFW